jgi:hypothetical protein
VHIKGRGNPRVGRGRRWRSRKKSETERIDSDTAESVGLVLLVMGGQHGARLEVPSSSARGHGVRSIGWGLPDVVSGYLHVGLDSHVSDLMSPGSTSGDPVPPSPVVWQCLLLL